MLMHSARIARLMRDSGFKSYPKKIRIKDESVLDVFRGKPCEVCGLPSDPAHIKSVGSGGDDELDDLISLCRKHHAMQHARGWERLFERFPNIESILNDKGWELVDIFGVKKLRRK